jgi:flagellum-specific peptidoglycan hydrolase FlgJ
MLTPQQQTALVQIAYASVASEKATGLPAELSSAQCIFESAWLARCPGNNCFGIQPDNHGAGVQYSISKEFLDGSWVTKQEAFERYDSLADCFTDHARLITQGEPYAAAWGRYLGSDPKDLDTLIRGICPVYATDPAYTTKILMEAHSETLAKSLAGARAAGGGGITT